VLGDERTNYVGSAPPDIGVLTAHRRSAPVPSACYCLRRPGDRPSLRMRRSDPIDPAAVDRPARLKRLPLPLFITVACCACRDTPVRITNRVGL